MNRFASSNQKEVENECGAVGMRTCALHNFDDSSSTRDWLCGLDDFAQWHIQA